MEGNKISVLVTFYNQERYVDDALGSIFMQETSFPFQVIVGDDGSNDGTVEKVKQWQSKYPGRLRLVIQERDHTKKYNGVVRASRNRLMICSLPGRQAKKQKAYCPEGGILCLSTRLIQQRNCRLYI